MKIIKVKKENEGYNVTLGDKTSHSIPYIKGTFLYKETKAFIEGEGVVEDEFSIDDLKLQELSKIDARFKEIESEKMRPMSSIKIAELKELKPDEYDVNKLIALEEESNTLRTERSLLA